MKVHDPELVTARVADGSWTEELLGDVFRAAARARPDEVALVDPPNTAELIGREPGRSTWAELETEVDRVSALLHEHGVRQHDVTLVQLPNTSEIVVTLLALWRLGAVAMPVPMQFREHEIGLVVAAARARAAVVGGEAGGNAPLESLQGMDPHARPPLVLAWGGGSADHWVGVVSLAGAAGDVGSWRTYVDGLDVDVNDAVTICWTSGTQSRPKAVPRAHCDWLAVSWFGVDPPDLTADDVLLNPFPLVNMAAFCGLLLPWLRCGSRLVMHHPFDLPIFLGQVATERVTYTVAPPAVLTMLLHKPEVLAQVDISSLSRIGSGSAPLPPPMVRGWHDRYGIGIINFFGSNEGIGLISAPRDVADPEERARFFPRWDAPGAQWSARGAGHLRYRLVDPATDEEIREPGRPGELRILGPVVFGGYLPGTSAVDPFDQDGYLCSGDVFEIAGEHDEYLRFVDRADDLVIRGGMNISPAEVEGLLSSHPAVAEAAVVGVADEVLGARVCAVVVAADAQSPTLGDLVEHLRAQRVASYKLPERLEVVEALPRNPLGKVVRRQLREALAAQPG